MNTNHRSIDIGELRTFVNAAVARDHQLSARALGDLVCSWAASRALVPPPPVPHLEFEAWLDQSPERMCRLLAECSRSEIEWVDRVEAEVDYLAGIYVGLVDQSGAIVSDPFSALIRALVVTVKRERDLERARHLCADAIYAWSKDTAWRRLRAGVDLFTVSAGEVLFGRPFGSSNKNGPCGTEHVWPRRLDALRNSSAPSELEQMLSAFGGAA